MNGAHDMGGMQGFGPVDAEPESDEPIFHAEWERRAFALTLTSAMIGRWNIDMSRFARERQHPIDYLEHTYYENWLAGLYKLLVEAGLVTEDELAAGKPLTSPTDPDQISVADAEAAVKLLNRGGPTQMDSDRPPAFKTGDKVRVLNLHPAGHTRAPRYTRGREGVIHHGHGVHVFADEHAKGNRVGEHLYSVRFQARDLWGPQAPARDAVHVDLWEPHLEAL